MVVVAAALTACAAMQPGTPPEVGDLSVATQPAATAHTTPTEPDIQLARGDQPIEARRRDRLAAGADSLSASSVGYYMDVQEARLRQTFARSDILIRRDADRIILVIPGVTTFETGSARLNPAFHPALDAIAVVLAEYSKTLVSLEGHTDDVGAEQFNQALSEQRAMALGHYLANKGIDRQRLVVRGFGETRPVASNDSDAGRARNRRVELALVPLVAS